MVVLILTSCPAGLRGHLTRWLMEVSAGVFVGRLNPKLRDHVWDLVLEAARGHALMVFTDREREQGFGFRTNDHDWIPTDVEGVTLMLRPGLRRTTSLRKGWSNASRYRRRSSSREGMTKVNGSQPSVG